MPHVANFTPPRIDCMIAAALGSTQRMATDECRRTRKSARRVHDGPLGAADVGDDDRAGTPGCQLLQQVDILHDRCRKDDEIGR